MVVFYVLFSRLISDSYEDAVICLIFLSFFMLFVRTIKLMMRQILSKYHVFLLLSLIIFHFIYKKYIQKQKD